MKIFRNRKFKNGLNGVVLLVAVLGIAVLLNITFSKYTFRKDVTASKKIELSEQTKNILTNLDKLDKKVNVYLFKGSDPGLEQKYRGLIEALLKQYANSSASINFRTLDLNKNPGLANKYGVKSIYEVVFEMGDRTNRVAVWDQFDGINFNGEYAYTSAIINLLNEKRSVVYFIQGHKEANLKKDLTELSKRIELEGYEIKPLTISLEGNIPDDASMIVDIGAKTDFSPSELNIVKSYLDGGGKAAFFMASLFNDPQPQITGLNGLFKNYGIHFNDDIVFDLERGYPNTKDMVMPEYGTGEVVSKLKEQEGYLMLIPDSRSITVTNGVNNIIAESLLKSSADSWGETNIDEYKNQKVKLDNADIKGPLTLAAYATKDIVSDKQMKLLVAGNDLIAMDQIFYNFKNRANLDFILNAMGVLSGTKQTVAIRPKPMDISYMTIIPKAQINIAVFLVLLLPAGVWALGFVVWLRRRNL